MTAQTEQFELFSTKSLCDKVVAVENVLDTNTAEYNSDYLDQVIIEEADNPGILSNILHCVEDVALRTNSTELVDYLLSRHQVYNDSEYLCNLITKQASYIRSNYRS